jgi:hypothetical protein
MQNACALLCCHLRSLWLYIVFHIISRTAWLSEKNVLEHKVWDLPGVYVCLIVCDIVYDRKTRKKTWESYWMTLRKGDDTLIWKRMLWIALYGELTLEEALDLDYLNEWIYTSQLGGLDRNWAVVPPEIKKTLSLCSSHEVVVSGFWFLLKIYCLSIC